MKQIQPITIWVNGQQQTASLFNLVIINDNLLNSATFYWQLLSSTQAEDSNLQTSKLADGNLTMIEPQYDQWGTSSDVNQWAYEWAATQLNITLA
jgi:hypothetical protein